MINKRGSRAGSKSIRLQRNGSEKKLRSRSSAKSGTNTVSPLQLNVVDGIGTSAGCSRLEITSASSNRTICARFFVIPPKLPEPTIALAANDSEQQLAEVR